MTYKSEKRDQWILSDTHFGHENIMKFEPETFGRFDSIEDRDAYIVERINSVVKPGDRLYFLGDVALKKRHLQILEMINGDKVLVKGNHDIYKLKDYTPYFEDIRSCMVFNFKDYDDSGKKIDPVKVIFSHIPIHEDQLERFGFNVHGHLHSNTVKTHNLSQFSELTETGNLFEKHYGVGDDVRYINVCMEHLNDLTPIHIDDIINRVRKIKKEIICKG